MHPESQCPIHNISRSINQDVSKLNDYKEQHFALLTAEQVEQCSAVIQATLPFTGETVCSDCQTTCKGKKINQNNQQPA